ncbi:calexcitin-1 isoform X1 [Athalia rosae]|uniref:calexcitin-1 isoform X1 n=1 Tax=Athalia rosae TaxID=37344 RepID=UPI0006253B54|nr:calexcitin-1 isoform X1 [Athalia rosae]
MPISEFRKNKLLYVFNVFFDVNQSGTIEKKDFELAIQKICQNRGWAPGNPKNQQTHDTLLKVWDGLRQRADANHDGQVSREEWCSMWEEYAKDPSQALEWQQRYMNFIFDLEDTSDDGRIDEEEFTSVCTTYGIPESDCRTAFNKLSGQKKEVSREEFTELWKQYFASDDQSAPGNFIFGKNSFN